MKVLTSRTGSRAACAACATDPHTNTRPNAAARGPILASERAVPIVETVPRLRRTGVPAIVCGVLAARVN
ncbi:hypothetical protein [Lysobacter gummosus]|uniref:hypothetical protein n=1 Tax=Lysobacter gummosus TaxID=262324 RepID=UPI00362F2F2B